MSDVDIRDFHVETTRLQTSSTSTEHSKKSLNDHSAYHPSDRNNLKLWNSKKSRNFVRTGYCRKDSTNKCCTKCAQVTNIYTSTSLITYPVYISVTKILHGYIKPGNSKMDVRYKGRLRTPIVLPWRVTPSNKPLRLHLCLRALIRNDAKLQ